MIPTTRPGVNVEDLHPVLYARVEALCADPRMEGRLAVVSGVRGYDEQVQLYQGFINGWPGYNTAADPDRPIGAAYDLPAGRGSFHMEQPNGYGYAVDFNHSALPAHVEAIFHEVAAEYLLEFTVPGEPWHAQMFRSDWTTLPEGDDPMTDDDRKWVSAQLEKLRSDINREQNKDRREVSGAGSITRKELAAIRTAVGEVKSQAEANATSLATLLLRIPGVQKGGAVLAKLDQLLARREGAGGGEAGDEQ